MARDGGGRRLDLPRQSRRSLISTPSVDPDTFGRFAEQFARFLGTARFIAYMTAFVIVWIAINVIGLLGLRWDPYPFILLNLFFSTQASYAAPLILLAQNRQADRDRVTIEQDRVRDERTLADTEYLTREVAALRMALGEVATRDFVRSELRALLDELDQRDRLGVGTDGDSAAPRPVPAKGTSSLPASPGTPAPPSKMSER